MKYLGIDYGAKRIGLAISDESGMFAFPLEVIAQYQSLARIKTLIIERQVGHVVMGDTRSYGNAENPITAQAEDFARTLKEESHIPVQLVFEAGSSVEASRFAPEGKEHDDASAAAIILQRYLDARQ